MRHPWANIALLVLLVVELVTGVLGIVGGPVGPPPVFWAHAVGAYAIVVLLAFKGRIVVSAIRRRGLDPARAAFLAMLALLVVTLGTALVWVLGGPRYVGPISLINVHAYLAILLVGLLASHLAARRWIFRVPAARDRRSFLRLAGVTVAGLVVWQGERAAQAVLGLPGRARRFTGSYERGSFTGRFPHVSWLLDDPDPVTAGDWALELVAGDETRTLTLADLDALPQRTLTALLDCTGGWYTEQHWTGVPVGALLELVGVPAGAASVHVEARTGYGRRFALGDARELLLATAVADDPLDHGHGAPARLVAPGRRGYDWVKWVSRISVDGTSPLLQPPLPLR